MVKNSIKLALVLHDLRSVQNVATLFRTADCAGVSKLFLVGTTPTPIDRFKRLRGDFAKISLGAETTVPYEYVATIDELMEKFKEEGYQLVALEQSKESIDYKTFAPTGNVALMVGNEVSGVPHDVLTQCDQVIEIPMMGTKESLNVSIAAAVAVFRVMNI